MGTAPGAPAEADSGGCRTAADAAASAGAGADFRGDGARRIHGGKGVSGNATRLLSGRESVPAAAGGGKVTRSSGSAWPLEAGTAGKQRSRVDAGSVRKSGAAR